VNSDLEVAARVNIAFDLPSSAGFIEGLKGTIWMNRTFKASVAALMLAVGLAGPVAAGPYEDAVAVYDKGDNATALRLFRPLAEQGDARAQYRLGIFYENAPMGVPRDYVAAASWYRKAADQGVSGAQYALGVMYIHGLGVPQDYSAGMNWYRKAADQGNAIAQYALGVEFFTGWRVPQDYVSALKWFNLAAASGNKDAAEGWDSGSRVSKMATDAGANVSAKMTLAQILEAQKLAREWKPTAPDK
jgi:uncharacterized protein